MEEFAVGDVVELVSGGPRMTVTGPVRTFGAKEEPAVHCQWFSGKKLESGEFPVKNLVRCKTDDSGKE